MNILKIYRQRILFVVIYLVLSAVILHLVDQDAELYRNSVVKITEVSEQEYGENTGNDDLHTYVQTITGIVQNGEWAGSQITFENMYSESLTVDEKYKTGDSLITDISENEEGEQKVSIISLKRDTVIVFMLLTLVFVVLFFIKAKGIFTLLSVLVNVILLYLSLEKLNQGKNTLLLAVGLMAAFTVLSLVISCGFHKSTFAAVLISAVTTAATALIYFIVLKVGGEPEYFMMDYVEYLPNSRIVPQLFFAEIMIGSLGAVMDVAISITSTVDELVRLDPEISAGVLYRAVRQVGYDIMGTMVNVLFFSYFCGTIPMILMKMQNNYGFSEIFRYHLPFEVIRFLTGSIGIILAIPTAGVLSILILSKRRDSE